MSAGSPEPPDFRTKPTRCPHCMQEVDAALHVVGRAPRPPVAGDFTVCVACGRICVFTEAGGLRRAAPPDLRRLAPEARRELLRVAAAVEMQRLDIRRRPDRN